MQNYIQNGHIVRVTTPAGGIASGDALIVGSLFGVAAYSSVEGDPVEISTTGVFQLPKASTAVLTVGMGVAWDNTGKEVATFRLRGASPSAWRSRRRGAASPASRCGWTAWRRRRHDPLHRECCSFQHRPYAKHAGGMLQTKTCPFS